MYHKVSRNESQRPGTEAGHSSAREDGKKERVLHTRIPRVLERELKRFAQNLRVPVSNLVRTILEDAIDAADVATEGVEQKLKRAADQLGSERARLKKRLQRDPLADVLAFQAVTLAQSASCARCGLDLERGTLVHLALTDDRPKGAGRIFVCESCLPKGGSSERRRR